MFLANFSSRTSLRVVAWFFLCCGISFSHFLQAQIPLGTDCLQDPSCQHTKAMMQLARQQWDSLPLNQNTNRRSDTFDVIDYQVVLDMTDHANKFMHGHCTVLLRPLMTGIQSLPLDLLGLQVDSVVYQNQSLPFSYNDTLLQSYFPQPLAKNVPIQVTVYYQGTPQSDAKWGGFYYEGEYAYNLGVGFAADPHTYGRVWHPCVDNFRERATYRFEITTLAPQRAHCNGLLLNETKIGPQITRIWQQKEPIPTYLACIAVAPYVVLKDDYVGLNDTIPIRLAAEPADTANLAASFVHLPDAIQTFEHWYGPHRWAKVGYSLVPFRSGAMEHASNITYPRFAANGTLARERLMAHELGHSWWGNLVTCASAEDMWINEGMASYSEHLFVEAVYGPAAYRKAVKDNHYLVLRQAHQREGGYRPISGVPHEYTYGMHVYKKGAAVAHNLRWYMGDEVFRQSIRYVMDSAAYQNLTSYALRDALSRYSGLNLIPFFDDWVFQGGFPHIDAVAWSSELKNGAYHVQLVLRQTLIGRTTYFEELPVPVTFFDAAGNRETKVLRSSGPLDTFECVLQREPTSVLINEWHQLNQARFDEHLALDSSQLGTVVLTRTTLLWEELRLLHWEDSANIHLHRHPVMVYTAPNHLPKNYTLDSSQYWSVSGAFPTHYEAWATLRPRLSKTQRSEHPTVLLYRENANTPWRLHPSVLSGKWLGAGVLVFALLPGEYVLARGAAAPHSEEARNRPTPHYLRQAPENRQWTVEWKFDPSTRVQFWLYDDQGKAIYQSSRRASAGEEHITCPIEKGRPYFIKWVNAQGKVVHSRRLLPTL